jgi:hypothetical protein
MKTIIRQRTALSAVESATSPGPRHADFVIHRAQAGMTAALRSRIGVTGFSSSSGCVSSGLFIEDVPDGHDRRDSEITASEAIHDVGISIRHDHQAIYTESLWKHLCHQGVVTIRVVFDVDASASFRKQLFPRRREALPVGKDHAGRLMTLTTSAHQGHRRIFGNAFVGTAL